MPAVTIEDSNATVNGENLPCPHVREKNGENLQIEESKDMEIKENATQSKETGGK